MNYVTAKEAREFFKCSGPCLLYWRKNGKIRTKRFSDRKILYDIDSYKENEELSDVDERNNVIYARVSTSKQKDDLSKQIETVKNYCLNNGIKITEVYQDIASGMNTKRKSLNKLIDDVIAGKISKVYVSFKDRISRFGFEYFQSIFSKYDTEIVVLDENENTNKTFQDELTDDLISIIHYFSMRMYSNRRNKLKEMEKLLKEEN